MSMWVCLLHVMLCTADRMCVYVSVYVHHTSIAVSKKKNISAASSTKHREKMISQHLTGASCNADDNKTTELQREAEFLVSSLAKQLYHAEISTTAPLLLLGVATPPCIHRLASLLGFLLL